MKHLYYAQRMTALLLVLFTLLSVPAFAFVRDSDHIMSYDMEAKALDDGEIAIRFSVIGPDTMAKIGASEILIYEDFRGSWLPVGAFDENDPDMSVNDYFYHGSVIYFSGYTGTDYKVVVTIFAEDYAGKSDSRSETFYITA